MTGSASCEYDPNPRYEPVDGVVLSGWAALSGPVARVRVLAVDGPEIAPWNELVSQLRRAGDRRDVVVDLIDAREGMASWETIRDLTSSIELAEDPALEKLAAASLEDLFETPVHAQGDTGARTVIFGPGAALSRHDELWYSDQPKRYAEAAVSTGSGRNLGQQGTPVISTRRRLFYVDWPILDRHRDTIAPMVSLWIDAQNPHRPTALDAATLAATAAAFGPATVPHPSHVQHHCLVRSLGAAATGVGHRPAEQCTGL